MEATVQLEGVDRVIAQARRFAQQHVIDEKFVCRDQLRLWALSLVRGTPPGRPGDTFAIQRKKGFEKVERDIARVFLSIEGGQIASAWSGPGVPSGHAAIRFTSGHVVAVPQEQFDMNVSDERMKEHYKKYWDPATGKVRGHRVKHDDGNWTVLDGFVTDARNVRRFTKTQQRKVGILKAGWMPATEYYARLTGGKTTSAPKWVSAQSHRSGLGAEHWSGGDGYVSGTNLVPWANRNVSGSLLNATARIREKDLRVQAIKRYSRLIERANAER